jgi:hypothetical protein
VVVRAEEDVEGDIPVVRIALLGYLEQAGGLSLDLDRPAAVARVGDLLPQLGLVVVPPPPTDVRVLQQLDQPREVRVTDLPQDKPLAAKRQGVGVTGWLAWKMPSGSCAALAAPSRA